jgi:hypothetical protein
MAWPPSIPRSEAIRPRRLACSTSAALKRASRAVAHDHPPRDIDLLEPMAREPLPARSPGM